LGSLLGVGCFFFAMFAMTALEWPESVPLGGFLVYFLFVFPMAAICLLVIGVPAALALRNSAERGWMPPLAPIAGAVTGQFVAYALGFHEWGAGPGNLLNLGMVTGAVTAFLWHRFAKPRILSDEKE
jgi:NhaP-type Na+/H+ or K+/H+ antiporter